MTKIYFYFNVREIDQLINKIADEITSANNSGFILVGDSLSELINRALWQKPQLAFIAHALPNYPQINNLPFVVCENKDFAEKFEELLNFEPINVNVENQKLKRNTIINLDGNPLPRFASLGVVYEIIPHPEILTHSAFPAPDKAILRARERFRHYRERGYEIINTDMANIIN